MPRRRLEPSHLVLFIDRSLGGRIVADALRSAGATVEVHDDHFRPDTTDAEWLRQVGQRGWVVLLKDARIRRDRFERSALEAANVKAFFLTQQGLTGIEMAQIFVTALEGIRRRAGRQPGPFIYTVSRGGAFNRID